MHEFLSHTKPPHRVINPRMETVPTILTPLKIMSGTLLKNLKDASLRGRNISTDRLYTSISLVNWLLEHGITTVGTLNTIRIGIPDEIKQTIDRKEFSATYHVDSSGNLYLTSYAVRTKSKGKNNVLVLAIMRPFPGATRDDGYHKPAIIKLYDFTKGGTDIVDQINYYHTCRSRTFRWGVQTALFYVLDTIRVNSKTIWCIKQGLDVQKFKSFDFAWELAMQLIKPFIRSRNINGLQRMTLERMERILGGKIQVGPQTNGKRKQYPYPHTDERPRRNQCEKGSSKQEKSNLPKKKENCGSCEIAVY